MDTHSRLRKQHCPDEDLRDVTDLKAFMAEPVNRNGSDHAGGEGLAAEELGQRETRNQAQGQWQKRQRPLTGGESLLQGDEELKNTNVKPCSKVGCKKGDDIDIRPVPHICESDAELLQEKQQDPADADPVLPKHP